MVLLLLSLATVKLIRLSALLLIATGCAADTDADVTDCTDIRGLADAVCVPNSAPVDTPIQIEAREGCTGCGRSISGCTVERSGDMLKVVMVGQSCTLRRDLACPAVCGIATVQCETPPLPAGDYAISGLKAGTSTASPILRVRSTGDEMRCSLPSF